MSADAADDASIPMLTERLTLPPLELDTTLPQEPQATPAPVPSAPLALDTSLPMTPLALGLPQQPQPFRATPAAPRPAPAAPRPTPAANPETAPAARASVPAPASTPPAPRPSVTATIPTAPHVRRAVPPTGAAAPPARAAAPATAATIIGGLAAASAPAPAVVPTETPSAHWSRIELSLRSSILQAIADSLPEQIDGIVRNRMNDSIERLFTQLVAETRLAVAASLRDIVDQAVRAELARLRSQR